MKGKASQPTHDASLPVKRAPNGILYFSYRPGSLGDQVRRHFAGKFGHEPAEVFINTIDGSVRAGPVGAPPAASPEPAVVATAEPLAETESSFAAGEQLKLL